MRVVKYTIFLLSLLTLIVTSAVVAQDDNPSPAEPLTEEETLTLLEETGVNVFPFSMIEGSAPILAGLSANSTRVEVTTTIPVSCLILYGETMEFGQVAQDSDMGATGAHEDHQPLLTNLEPETTYYYRLQGSDVNGNFYVSEIFTFTTPAESDEVSDNLLSPSRGAEVLEVSSNFNNGANDSSFGIDNAFDDDPNTQWSSNGDGDDAYFVVELGQPSLINTISFWTRTMSNNTAQIFSFTVTTDSDEVYGPFELPDPDQAYEFEVDFVASTLRFDIVDSNGGNTGAVEVAVYGETLDE